MLFRSFFVFFVSQSRYKVGSTDELEVYELIEFNYKDGVYYLVYEPKELTRMAPEKVKEYKQLKHLLLHCSQFWQTAFVDWE